MASVTTNELLDVAPTVGGQRFEDFAFELLDASHNVIGTLAVDEGASPNVTFDTQRATMRTCTGLKISASDLASIDTARDRVRPRLVLQNNARRSLGVFMFGTDARAPYSWGTRWTPDLFDESFLLAQDLDRTVSLRPGGSILGLIRQLVGEVGITDFDIQVADQPSSGALTFPATGSRNDAVNALVAALGGYPAFLANDGAFTMKAIPSDGAGPDHVYGPNTSLIDGTANIVKSSYKAPNEYIVSNGDANAPVVGTYKLPDAAPNSQARTGFVVTKTTTVNGITAAVANDVAKALAITDASSYTQATWSSLADPRHSGFDIVSLYGDLYVETGWSVTCVPGGLMTHNATGIYA